MKIKRGIKGFTLIELLMVVLIIGILSAIALPGYRRSVEKSRVSDALTTMTAVAKSEHGWYLNNNSYTNDFANLDIDLNGTIDEGALETEFYTYELIDTGILAERNNGEYTLYKDYESSQVLCMPGDHYVCEDLIPFTKEPCEKAGMAWANKNSICYADRETRCKSEYGENIWKSEEDVCGYVNGEGSKAIYEGMICKGPGRWSCGSSIIDGGICLGNTTGSDNCSGVTVKNGGICAGGSCGTGSKIQDGGICLSVPPEGWCKNATYTGTGCCCYGGGKGGCGSKPVCDADTCAEAKARYQAAVAGTY